MLEFSKEAEVLAFEILKLVHDGDSLLSLEENPLFMNAIAINVERGLLTGIKVLKNANGNYVGQFVAQSNGVLSLTPKGLEYLQSV